MADETQETTDSTQETEDTTQDSTTGSTDGTGSAEGTGEGSTDTDAETVLRAENQRLKREAAAREKDRRKAEAEARKAEEQRKAEQGQWKELAEERAREVDTLKTQLAERDRKDAERDKRGRVEKVADRLNFRRPQRVYALLVDELGQEEADSALEDDQLTERALRNLARDMPELVDQQRRSGAPVNGSRGDGGLTPQQRGNRIVAGLLAGAAPRE